MVCECSPGLLYIWEYDVKRFQICWIVFDLYKAFLGKLSWNHVDNSPPERQKHAKLRKCIIRFSAPKYSKTLQRVATGEVRQRNMKSTDPSSSAPTL